ncbi:MAG: hypothetical protein Q4G07_01855 [Oscillospiraceae bacterium]|nr:hypothetical protein [Oscillospiraceae bacterium]
MKSLSWNRITAACIYVVIFFEQMLAFRILMNNETLTSLPLYYMVQFFVSFGFLWAAFYVADTKKEKLDNRFFALNLVYIVFTGIYYYADLTLSQTLIKTVTGTVDIAATVPAYIILAVKLLLVAAAALLATTQFKGKKEKAVLPAPGAEEEPAAPAEEAE